MGIKKINEKKRKGRGEKKKREKGGKGRKEKGQLIK